MGHLIENRAAFYSFLAFMYFGYYAEGRKTKRVHGEDSTEQHEYAWQKKEIESVMIDEPFVAVVRMRWLQQSDHVSVLKLFWWCLCI
jgi:hypothetical protein